ncbi:MAG TPA: hypothetical protein VEW28_03045 [Candidatus Kapabacteria bacterium]|nr:hypothetical protein [Candidatus Kapabacteria bacterium]
MNDRESVHDHIVDEVTRLIEKTETIDYALRDAPTGKELESIKNQITEKIEDIFGILRKEKLIE